MTPAEILLSLFGDDHDVTFSGNILHGPAALQGGGSVHILGYANGAELGVDQAIVLAGRVIEIAQSADQAPILFLVDSSSQRMSRRDELMGLSEYLSHLAKSLLFAEQAGHRTIGLLYGGSAAGAFIVTTLACGVLAALPGAHPEVMDLPSMARVTKLSLELLTQKAQATPVFAPGLDNLAQTGAVRVVWDADQPLGPQLIALLQIPLESDARDVLGRERNGRPKAAEIAATVLALAQAHG